MAPASRDDGGQSRGNHDRLPLPDDESVALSNMLPSRDDDEGRPVEITAVQKMLSATTGSLLTGLLVTPLDVVRVRLQSQNVPQPANPPSATASSLGPEFQRLAVSTPNAFRPSTLGVTACCREVFFMNNTSEVGCLAAPRSNLGGGSAAAAGECAVEQTQQRVFHSTLDGLRKIARNEGLPTLWRGLSPTLVMAIPGNIIYFTGYEWLRFNPHSPLHRILPPPSKNDPSSSSSSYTAPLVAGAGARVLAAAAVGPVELFRTRLQASHGSSAAGHVADTLRGLRDMVALRGYRSLWRGLTLTLWRDVPFSGMYWLGYETTRNALAEARERGRQRQHHGDVAAPRRSRSRSRSRDEENHRETFADSFVAGAVSGAFASVATMPFDVGKTRTQVHRDSAAAVTGAASASSSAVPEEQNMVRLLWHIFRTEGVAGLFRGWIPRTLKVAPACAIMISSYEVGKKVFRGVNERAALRAREAGGTGGP